MTLDSFLGYTVTLFFILDPFGNVPIYVSVLAGVAEEKRTRVVIREALIALGLLLLVLVFGNAALSALDISPPAIRLSGGLILFLIAIRMIYPGEKSTAGGDASPDSDPIIVPLATPLVAGPSAIAFITINSPHDPGELLQLGGGVLLAWFAATLILVYSGGIGRVLGERGLRAVERLMGMLLTILSAEMLLQGTREFIASI